MADADKETAMVADEPLLDECVVGDEDDVWAQDSTGSNVVLKADPSEMRVPETLFKKLFPFQRSGIHWLCMRSTKNSGGILAE